MSGLDDDRFHDLLQLIGELRQAIAAADAKMEEQLLSHWKAASTAIRTLADWWVREADKDVRERTARQAELDAHLTDIRDEQEKARLDRERLQVMVYILAGMVLVVIALVIGARWL